MSEVSSSPLLASPPPGIDALRRRNAEAAQSVARESLFFTVRYCDAGYQVGRVHSALMKLLERIERGECRRVIINTPPRHGKSRMVAIEAPAWLLGRDPRRKILTASYSSHLSTKHSRECLERLRTHNYQALFPGTRLSKLRQSSGDWLTTEGGGYMATSVSGSSTGMGADFIIVDDPVKDYEEAHSPGMREKVWNWYLSTAYTRLSPGGVVVVIMTRWHEDDLAGRLLNAERQKDIEASGGTGEKWEVVNLPAIAHAGDPIGRMPGDALWPERFPVDKLAGIKATLGSYLWAALYEGSPVAKGGNYVNPENFVIVEPGEVPHGLRQMRFWDLATSSDAMSDFTAGAKGGIHAATGDFYVTDLTFGQWDWPKGRSVICALGEADKVLVGVEAVGGFKTTFANLREVMHPEVSMKEFGADTDKLTRALPWIALTESRKVKLVRAPWNDAFKRQAASFPNGKNDDLVDAVSGLHIMLKKSRPIVLV